MESKQIFQRPWDSRESKKRKQTSSNTEFWNPYRKGIRGISCIKWCPRLYPTWFLLHPLSSRSNFWREKQNPCLWTFLMHSIYVKLGKAFIQTVEVKCYSAQADYQKRRIFCCKVSPFLCWQKGHIGTTINPEEDDRDSRWINSCQSITISENTIKSRTNWSHALWLVSWMNNGDDDIEIPSKSRYFNSCWSIAKSQNMIQKHSKQNQTEAILSDQQPGWELNLITCSSALKLLPFHKRRVWCCPDCRIQ